MLDPSKFSSYEDEPNFVPNSFLSSIAVYVIMQKINVICVGATFIIWILHGP